MLESVQSDGTYAIIVSDAVEIVLFGIYTIFYTFALIILTICRRPLPIHWTMVASTTVLFAACMTHCSMVTTDRHTTFTSGWPIPSGRELSGLLRVTDIQFKLCGFLSQLVMIHRCWTVWDYRYPIVVGPLIMAIAAMICALVGPIRLDTSEFVSPFVAPRLLAFDMAFCVISLLVYVLVTYLIILHLRRVSAPLRNFRSTEALVWSLASACIQAGGLLVIAQLSVVILLALNDPAVIIAESVATQVYVRPSLIHSHPFRISPLSSTRPPQSSAVSSIFVSIRLELIWFSRRESHQRSWSSGWA
ncbi:hypothetical protein C8Q80DRAFT_1321875 [Daedaleopsis nitida]|nr:hypothetical protein C8Q80DRAFT_1321875 [Daedaleopsis nitida]